MADQDWTMRVCSEFCGVMPDGGIKPADVAEHWRVDGGGTVKLVSPRNGWVSLRLVIKGRGEFAVRCETDTLDVDLFREFYHKLKDEDLWLPDALVPIENGSVLAIPAPDNECAAQAVQSVWVDLFVPRDAKPGTHTARLCVSAGGAEQSVALALDVLDLAYPDEDCVHMDHNTYVHGWIPRQYPKTVSAEPGPGQWDAMIPVIHAYHRMCFEHHGIFHHLGTGHTGKAWELYNPRVAGRGRDMHAVDWTWYDKHIGPLLSGAAFEGGRRRPLPLHTIYTAYTPSWPADYVGWGREGYRVELANVLRDHDAHLRENGWTHTIQEFFFNHKKRYHAFPWDGDEPRFPTTDRYWRAYREIIDEAVGDSPVPWRLRMDGSWSLGRHLKDLLGIVDFWVCSGWVDFWKDEVQSGPLARGDVVWTYGPSVDIQTCTAALIQYVYRTWVRGFGGYERWLTTGVRGDPWLASDGAMLAWFYPGEKFGIAGPIPTVRLKVQRNAVQDINLMDRIADAKGESYRAACIESIPIRLWRKPSRAMLEKPPHEWNPSVDVPARHEPDEQRVQSVDPQWWVPVRGRVLAEAQEVLRG
jgi:hypothetical protein